MSDPQLGSPTPHAGPPPPPTWWSPPRPSHPRAVPAMVLGLVGLGGLLFVLPFVLSPLAWYWGAVARREAERDEARWSPSGAATAGMVTGAIGTVLLVGGAVVIIGLAVLTSVFSGMDTGYGA